MPSNMPPTSHSCISAAAVSAATVVGSLTPANRRQKSWDLLDQNAIAQARQQKNNSTTQQVTFKKFYI